MRKVWLIIKREYVTHVKSKGFVISTIVVPLIGAGFFVMMAFVTHRALTHPVRLAILDDSGALAPSISHALDEKLPDGRPEFSVVSSILRPSSPEAARKDLRARISSGALDAYLAIPRDLDRPIELHTRNPNNFTLLSPLTAAVNQALVAQRLSARGIHVADVGAVLRPADLQIIKVGRAGESVDRGQSVAIAITLVMLLYMALMMYGITTMRSVLEEKTTRTMELLIASVRPFPLLCGKILGVGAVAFTQFLIWVVTLGAAFSYGVVMSGGIPASARVPPALLVFAVFFFVAGYFLYSSIYAAIGAACSNEQDAQQLQWVATLPLVFSVLVFSMIMSDPASRLSVVLSEIPFFAPILMTLRIALQTPPVWQIALSIVLLLLTVVGALYASAKIYRVGILMYGKRPTLPELVRWLRYS